MIIFLLFPSSYIYNKSCVLETSSIFVIRRGVLLRWIRWIDPRIKTSSISRSVWGGNVLPCYLMMVTEPVHETSDLEKKLMTVCPKIITMFMTAASKLFRLNLKELFIVSTVSWPGNWISEGRRESGTESCVSDRDERDQGLGRAAVWTGAAHGWNQEDCAGAEWPDSGTHGLQSQC